MKLTSQTGDKEPRANSADRNVPGKYTETCEIRHSLCNESLVRRT